jgi:hypothetical protein
MDKTGVSNPFNMGHIKLAHEDDSETSEFGVGMKAGALSAANQLNVYSRITGTDGKYKYIEVICDFIRMSKEADVNSSYNPRIMEISYEDYRDNHPFEFGTTIKLSKIRDGIYPRTTQQSITDDICKELSETYSRFILGGMVIDVNGALAVPIYDYFTDPKCIPFIVKRDIFVLDNGGLRYYIARQTSNTFDAKKQRLTQNSASWYKYDTKTKKWVSTNSDEIDMLRNTGFKSVYAEIDSDGVCLKLRTAFTFYSDRIHNATGDRINETPIPDDVTYIYKDCRVYGKKSLFKHIDGCHNFTLNDIEFVSKRLGKDIGITFNKEICMDGKNEIIIAIKSSFEDTRRGISANRTSTSYHNAFQKAVKFGIVNRNTCPAALLPIDKDAKKEPVVDALESVSNASYSEEEVIGPSGESAVRTNTNTNTNVVNNFFGISNINEATISSSENESDEETVGEQPYSPLAEVEHVSIGFTDFTEDCKSEIFRRFDPPSVSLENHPIPTLILRSGIDHEGESNENIVSQPIVSVPEPTPCNNNGVHEAKIVRMIGIVACIRKLVAEEITLDDSTLTLIETVLHMNA